MSLAEDGPDAAGTDFPTIDARCTGRADRYRTVVASTGRDGSSLLTGAPRLVAVGRPGCRRWWRTTRCATGPPFRHQMEPFSSKARTTKTTVSFRRLTQRPASLRTAPTKVDDRPTIVEPATD